MLVVDDEPPIVSYLCQVLDNEGYRTVCAHDGRSALEMARKHRPDCITMDIMMPGMGGEEAIRELHGDPQLASIPILAITVLQDYHCNDVKATLPKPIDERKLLDTLHSLLVRPTPDTKAIALTGSPLVPAYAQDSLASWNIEYCSEPELWARIDGGFKGTIIIPAEEIEHIGIAKLAGGDRLQVLILSERKERPGSQAIGIAPVDSGS